MSQPPRSKPQPQRRMRMVDIARLAGVHASTVSRALAGSPLVPEVTREQIAKLAGEHGYTVNQSARNLRLQRTQTIGVVIPLGHEVGQLISDPFFLELVGHLADEITARGYDLLLTKVAAPTAGWLDRLIQSQRADGLIVIGQSDQHTALNAAALQYLPLVVWGAHLPEQDYCSVGVDNIGGARLLVNHLIKAGRKRIAFLGIPELPEIGLRRRGYLEALTEAGLGVDPHLSAPAHFTAETAAAALATLRERGVAFDAIFCASDVIAMAAMRALQAEGRRVPQDVAVVGFDDVSLALQATPPLTTVRQDLGQGAAVLVDLLFKRLNGITTPSATLPAKLIIRESSPAPP